MFAKRGYLLVSVLAAIALALGCSGDTIKLDDYRKQVADVFATYDTDLSNLSDQLQTQGTKEEVFQSLSSYAGAGSQRTVALLTAWDALAVPERAKAVHQQGRALIESYKVAFDDLRAGADAGDEGARDVFNDQLENRIPGELRAFQDALNGLE